MHWVDAAFLVLSTVCLIVTCVTAYFAVYRAPKKKRERVLRFAEELKKTKHMRVIKDAAPKSGTVLTRERMTENLRSLSEPWGPKKVWIVEEWSSPPDGGIAGVFASKEAAERYAEEQGENMGDFYRGRRLGDGDYVIDEHEVN